MGLALTGLLHRGARDCHPARPAFMLPLSRHNYNLLSGILQAEIDNFCRRRCEEKSLRRRFCALRAVGGSASMVQIRSYVHPLCVFWAAPRGYNFLLRSSLRKPNRARRAQSAHVPNCGYVPNRGDGAGQRIICYQWPKAAMRRQGRRRVPACEVYPNRQRAFGAPLTAL